MKNEPDCMDNVLLFHCKVADFVPTAVHLPANPLGTLTHWAASQKGLSPPPLLGSDDLF